MEKPDSMFEKPWIEGRSPQRVDPLFQTHLNVSGDYWKVESFLHGAQLSSFHSVF